MLDVHCRQSLCTKCLSAMPKFLLKEHHHCFNLNAKLTSNHLVFEWLLVLCCKKKLLLITFENANVQKTANLLSCESECILTATINDAILISFVCVQIDVIQIIRESNYVRTYMYEQTCKSKGTICIVPKPLGSQ